MANIYGRQVVVPLTNKSGGSVAAGDVVIYDSTTNGSFTTTTSANSLLACGIAQETIANNATGRVLTLGYASLVNVNASVTRLNFGATFTVAKQATDVGSSRAAGTFMRFLSSGTTPDAVIYPVDLAGAALTNPMTTAEDIIVGGASGTPARLAKGNEGGLLSVTNGVLAYNAGTTMPTAATNARRWRTDLGMEFFYDGTRWRSMTIFEVSLSPWNITLGTGVTGTTSGAYRGAIPPLQGGTDIWLLSDTLAFYVNGGTALSASHKWVVTFNKTDSAAADTVVSTHTIDSGSSSVYRTDTQTINALLSTTYFIFSTTATKTGTPGNLIHFHNYRYQIVAT